MGRVKSASTVAILVCGLVPRPADSRAGDDGQDRAVAAIEAMRGSVARDQKGHLSSIYFMNPANDLPGSTELDKKVTDAGLAILEGLTDLRAVNFNGNGVITDAGIAHLAGLKKLEQLSLHGTGVTDVGLARLAGLEKLWSLDLRDSRVTDAGLAHLAGFKKLRSRASLGLLACSMPSISRVSPRSAGLARWAARR